MLFGFPATRRILPIATELHFIGKDNTGPCRTQSDAVCSSASGLVCVHRLLIRRLANWKLYLHVT